MEVLYEPSKFYNGNDLPKLRLLLVGNANVGKTSFIIRYMNNNFKEEYYPTNDIVIYKNMINFFPLLDEINEYKYVEIIDTPAYNRGKDLVEYSSFFSQDIYRESLLSFINTKLGKLREKIKYEYFFSQREKEKKISPADKEEKKVEKKLVISKRKLFTPVNVMAYLFILEYEDKESLEDVSDLATKLIEYEKSNEINVDLCTVKVFIVNKYPLIFEEDLTELDIKNIYKNDSLARDILKELIKHFENEKDAMEHIFFVNTKNNIGVNYTFKKVLDKLNQKEGLWKDKRYDSKDDVINNENQVNDGFLSKIFCCGGERINPVVKKKNEKEEKKQDEEDKLDEKFYAGDKKNQEYIEVNQHPIIKDEDEQNNFDLEYYKYHPELNKKNEENNYKKICTII